jgi:uncharacterized delta-60 repeat protein
MLESRQMFAAGALDNTFSLDGKATVSFPGALRATVEDVTVQTNGKTVVVGTVFFKVPDSSQAARRIGVARFNVDGSLDRSFGLQAGTVTLAVGDTRNVSASSVAISLTGQIVVAGTASTSDGPRFAVARLLSNGRIDTSFDKDGRTLIKVKDESFAQDVAVLADGKILVAGGDKNRGGTFSISKDSDFAIARLNIDGSLDKTFAGGGKRIIGLGGEESASAIAIDTNGVPGVSPNFGKIILAGDNRSSDASDDRYAIVRLTPDGALDTTFDRDGSVLAKLPGHFRVSVEGVVIQSNGKAVVSGSARFSSTEIKSTMFLARHNTRGSIDKRFGVDGDGVAYVDFDNSNQSGDVVTSARGGLVVAGLSRGKFALAGFTRDGRLDPGFGTDGTVITDFGDFGKTKRVGMAVAPNKRITVVGGEEFKTARFLDFGANLPAANIDINNLPQVTLEPTSNPGDGPVILVGTAPSRSLGTARIFSQVRI